MRVLLGAVVVFVSSCGVVSCGGQVATGSGDGGAGSSSGSVESSGSGGSGGGSSGSGSGSVGSGSSSGPIPPCPANTPAAGTACSGPGEQKCAYFEGNGTCQAFVCDGSSIWDSAPEGC